jgi:hypothetical protein
MQHVLADLAGGKAAVVLIDDSDVDIRARETHAL